MKGNELAKQVEDLDEKEQLNFYRDLYLSEMKKKSSRKRRIDELNNDSPIDFQRDVDNISDLANEKHEEEKDGRSCSPHMSIKKETQARSSTYEIYPDEVKKEAVELAVKYNNNTKAAKEIKKRYGSVNKYQRISEKSVREWRGVKALNPSYDVDKTQKSRIQIRDTAAAYPDMEANLIDLIKDYRKEGKPVTRTWIRARALEILANPTFKASEGWFTRFIQRNRLSLRVATKVVQKLTEDYSKEIVTYLSNIREQREKYQVKEGLDIIYGNVDQVPFQLDMSTGTTYHFTGEKEVKVLQTTGIKQRFTVQLTILSNGIFLPPLLVFKSRGKVPEALLKRYKDKALIYCNPSGWVTEEIFMDYLQKIWLNIKVKHKKEILFLILDKFSVHQTEKVKNALTNGNSLYAHIPAGCTGLLQPLDTCINKPLKDTFRSSFNNWFSDVATKPQNLTPKGYIRPPSSELVIEWILSGCRELSPTLVKKSFKHCSINNDLFGSENNLINPKVTVVEEVKKHLRLAFAERMDSPYNDKAEIETKIRSVEDGVSYDFSEEECNGDIVFQFSHPDEELQEEVHDIFQASEPDGVNQNEDMDVEVQSIPF